MIRFLLFIIKNPLLTALLLVGMASSAHSDNELQQDPNNAAILLGNALNNPALANAIVNLSNSQNANATESANTGWLLMGDALSVPDSGTALGNLSDGRDAPDSHSTQLPATNSSDWSGQTDAGTNLGNALGNPALGKALGDLFSSLSVDNETIQQTTALPKNTYSQSKSWDCLNPYKAINNFCQAITMDNVIVYSAGISQVEKLAQNGNLNAQLELGYRYTKGVRGTVQDLRKASQWFIAAAEAGQASAQFSIGVAYIYGYGVLTNHQKAMIWLTKAAEQGKEPRHQYMLATQYIDGIIVEKSLKNAAYWTQKAYENGSDVALDLWNKHELWHYQ